MPTATRSAAGAHRPRPPAPAPRPRVGTISTSLRLLGCALLLAGGAGRPPGGVGEQGLAVAAPGRPRAVRRAGRGPRRRDGGDQGARRRCSTHQHRLLPHLPRLEPAAQARQLRCTRSGLAAVRLVRGRPADQPRRSERDPRARDGHGARPPLHLGQAEKVPERTVLDYPKARGFGAFVQATAKRYKGKIDYYSLWNEPNLATWIRLRRGAAGFAGKASSTGGCGRRATGRSPASNRRRRNRVFFGEVAAIGQRGRASACATAGRAARV